MGFLNKRFSPPTHFQVECMFQGWSEACIMLAKQRKRSLCCNLVRLPPGAGGVITWGVSFVQPVTCLTKVSQLA